MSKEHVIILRDDVTDVAGEGVKTIEFIHEGVTYEAEMDAEARESYTAFLASYVEVARKVTKKPKAKATTAPKTAPAPPEKTPDYEKEYRARVRAWAKDNGKDCPIRGRIPQDLLDEFELAARSTTDPDWPAKAAVEQRARAMNGIAT
jgi:hypothetical protein